MVSIHILPIQFLYSDFLKPLQTCIESQFDIPSLIISYPFDYNNSFDTRRNQYNSSVILNDLFSVNYTDSVKLIGVTSLDLFIPVLTFVFGEAQLDGPTAVVSTHRLRPEYYGIPPNGPLVLQRLQKETVHEIGHTFGLGHCENFNCVLHPSTYVEEIDLKSVNFCDDCKNKLKNKKL
jgi:archaemetzincin